MQTPASIDEVQETVRSLSEVRIQGAGTKPALSNNATISTRALSGMLEYQPSEYTFTARAGTPLKDIQQQLAENGQFMPFDPPFVEAGATIGGTVAAGLSGPGRFRYGGVRDFFLGVKMVTGEGRIVFGGGKVVKNAAGFDLPKLMVGGQGRLGVLCELTFKVFPAPEIWTTLHAEFEDLSSATSIMNRLAVSQEELFCLDLEPPRRLWIRLGGLQEASEARAQRVQQFLADAEVTILRGDEDARVWTQAREFQWVPEFHRLVKIPISPVQVEQVEEQLTSSGIDIPRRYSVGGNVVWLAWPEGAPEELLDHVCGRLERQAMPLTGAWSTDAVVGGCDNTFLNRLLTVFDPGSKLARV